VNDVTVERLAPSDVLAVAQCIVLDVESFPHPSALFGCRDESVPAWVARARGATRVLGFVGGHARGGVLYIHGLAVAPEARRRGIGRALLRKAVEHAHRQQGHAVVLHVSVANPAAIALYDSEGFVVRRRAPDFYPEGAFGGERDAFEMVSTVESRRR
jgi:ribosomal protein S18 acetylase RimI-like enzyme